MSDPGSYVKEILGLSIETGMRPASTASPLDIVSAVRDLMTKENAGSVVVVENNRPVGIVTERDILQRVIKPGKNPDMTVANDIMSKPLVTIEADRTIGDALELLRRHNIRRVVVTRDEALVVLSTERQLLEIAHSQYLMQRIVPPKAVDDYAGHKIRIAYVSTYPPRECGVAMYTQHLVKAMSTFSTGSVMSPVVVAINDRGGHYNYEFRVKSQIEANHIDSYEKAAQYINTSNVDVLSGLFV